MSTLQNAYQDGDVFGFRYIFEQVGDGVRTLAHIEGTAHNIVVICGAVSIQVEGEPPKTVLEGQVGHFEWRKEHTIVALEPDTVALNLMIFGAPQRTGQVEATDE